MSSIRLAVAMLVEHRGRAELRRRARLAESGAHRQLSRRGGPRLEDPALQARLEAVRALRDLAGNFPELRAQICNCWRRGCGEGRRVPRPGAPARPPGDEALPASAGRERGRVVDTILIVVAAGGRPRNPRRASPIVPIALAAQPRQSHRAPRSPSWPPRRARRETLAYRGLSGPAGPSPAPSPPAGPGTRRSRFPPGARDRDLAQPRVIRVLGPVGSRLLELGVVRRP